MTNRIRAPSRGTMRRGARRVAAWVMLAVMLLELSIDVESKGSPGSSSYASRTGTYGAGSSTRYMLYPAAGVLLYYGLSRNYRGRYNSRDETENTNLNAARVSARRYIKLDITFSTMATNLAEVQFFDTDGVGTKLPLAISSAVDASNPVKTYPNLHDSLLDPVAIDLSGTNSASIIFDLGSAKRLIQYQLGASSSGALTGATYTMSNSDDKITWSVIDKVVAAGGRRKLSTDMAANSYLVTILGDDYETCPYGYYEPSLPAIAAIVTPAPAGAIAPAASAAGRNIVHNEESVLTVTSPLDCAKNCDEKGLACVGYVTQETALATVHCKLYGSDYTKNANGQTLKTTLVPTVDPTTGKTMLLCKKSGLVDCQTGTCQAVVPTTKRRLSEVGDDRDIPVMRMPQATVGSRTHHGERAAALSGDSDDARSFLCANGKRIAMHFCGDQIDDCGDSSDEVLPSPCPQGSAGAGPATDSLASLLAAAAAATTSAMSFGTIREAAQVLLHRLHIHRSPAVASLLERRVQQRERDGMVGKKVDFVVVAGTAEPPMVAPADGVLTLDLRQRMKLVVLSLRNSQSGAASKFKLQLADPRPEISCRDPGLEFTTVASGPLPSPVPHFQQVPNPTPTTELLLHGQLARCVRIVATSPFRTRGGGGAGPALGLGDISVFAATLTAAEQVQTARRLAETAPTAAECKSCPTFQYDDEVPVADIVAIVVSIFVGVLVCCWCCCRDKKQNYSQPTAAMAPAVGMKTLENQLDLSASPGNTLMVMCPPNTMAGQMISVQHPTNGQMVSVNVPPGIAPGMMFGVTMPGTAMTATVVSAEPAA